MPGVAIKKCWQRGGAEYSDTGDWDGNASFLFFFFFSSFWLEQDCEHRGGAVAQGGPGQEK